MKKIYIKRNVLLNIPFFLRKKSSNFEKKIEKNSPHFYLDFRGGYFGVVLKIFLDKL